VQKQKIRTGGSHKHEGAETLTCPASDQGGGEETTPRRWHWLMGCQRTGGRVGVPGGRGAVPVLKDACACAPRACARAVSVRQRPPRRRRGRGGGCCCGRGSCAWGLWRAACPSVSVCLWDTRSASPLAGPARGSAAAVSLCWVSPGPWASSQQEGPALWLLEEVAAAEVPEQFRSWQDLAQL